MRIALTHNLRLTDSEDEAEFDSRETIDALTAALERLGHRVERIEVSGPASRTAARIEAYSPELIFNTAEGRRGRFREAFYPALFDELGFPYTGSDAWVLAVTLDKSLTKLMLSEHGVISPRGQFIDDIVDLKLDGWRFPLIVKPNFEGSSKGITQDSVCEERGRLRALVEKTLARFPAGVLVEEFIPGKDLTVAFLEKAAPERQGVLTPVEYVIDEAELSKRRYRIYDYDLKSVHHEAVHVRTPAQFAGHILQRAQDMARKAYRALGCRDLGRIDFRIAEDGQVYFIEINALPSLEPGAGIYAAAALEGLHTDGVLAKVIESAAARWGLYDPGKRRNRPPRKAGPLRVGFTFNVKPNAVGSLKGVHRTSVVATEGELREAAREMIAKYDQPALIEDYIAGREFTVGLLGERRPKVLPPMEVVFLANEAHPVYSFEYKQDWSSKIRYDVPAQLEPGQLKALERAARECFIALGCRDGARADFRMDLQGRVYFLECNPLPGLTPGWSDLVLIAKAAGLESPALISEILSGAIRRYKERERERRESERGGATPPNGGAAASSPEEQKQEPQLRS